MPVPDTSAGAWNLTGRIATAIRTLWPLSPVQTMKPFEYVSSGVPVFRNVTVHGVLEPGAAVNEVTDGVAWIPARPSVENVYFSDFEPTLFAVRLTVWAPAMSPIAIDAELRSDASIGG